MSVTHTFNCAIADDAAAAAKGEVLPSHWNAGHTVTGYIPGISVSDYGAVGDGSTDDTQAIQDALDAANSAGGGMVFIPPGVYKITNSLIVYSKTHVVGAGRGATILRGKAGSYSGTTVNGGTIYCTIAMASADRSSIRGLTVDNYTNVTTANGIAILYDGTETASTDCVIQDCEVLGNGDTQYCIWNYKGVRSKILHNYVDGKETTRVSTSQEGIETYGGSDVLIDGNTVRNVCANGIYVWGDSDSGYPENVTVCNNSVSVCLRGIRVSAPATDIHVNNNQIINCWEAGIIITAGSSEEIDGLVISNNTIDTVDIGIYGSGESGAVMQRATIQGNSIYDTDDSASAGILLVQFTNTNVFNNNIRSSAGRGIYASSCSNIRVCGNFIDDSDLNGIRFNSVTNGQIFGNFLVNYNASDTGEPGIKIDSSSNINIDHNSFKWTEQYCYVISVGSSSSDRVIIGGGNNLLQTSQTNPTYNNAGTNPNRGTFTLTAASTSKQIINDLCNPSSQVWVQQTGGTQCPFRLTGISHGDFTISFAAAAGDETFMYEIR